MTSRATFLDSIELSSVPPATIRENSSVFRDSPTSSPALSRKPSYESLAALPQPNDLLYTNGGREDQNTRLRRLSMGEEHSAGGDKGMNELPPVDKGKQAWSFVVAAFILETFIWGFSYCYASILVYFQSHEPWNQYSLAALSSVGTIQLALEFMLPLVVLNVFRRYPDWVRTMLFVSAAVYSGSMLVASWATTVWQLILLQGILCGVSGSVLYTPVLLWLNDWFFERRGLASGIVFSGTGLGGCAFPFLIGTLLDKYGFAWMCRVWAFTTAAVFVASIFAIKPRVPLRKPVGDRPKWFLLDFKTINHPVVWVMATTTFVSSLAYFPVSLYLPTYTTSLLTTPDSLKPNLVVAIFNAAAMIGSNVTGWGSDLSLSATVSILGIFGSIVALSAWGTADSLAKVFGFAVLYGTSSQICSCWGGAASIVAGANPNTSTQIFCFFGIVRGIASIVGPFVSTSLYSEKEADSTNQQWGRFGFKSIIVFVGVMSFISSFGGIALGYLKQKMIVAKQKGSSGA